ncbi:MAG TPA: DsbA family protein [Candidatus Paceibacterota bacterium]|nr:DsbA family protein [Candidatus Paceibacterota bacterium]
MQHDDSGRDGAMIEIEEVRTEVPASTSARNDRFLPFSILIAAAVIGGSIVFSTLYRPSDGGAGAQNGGGTGAGVQAGTLTPADVMKLGPRDAVLGDKNAPVTLVEYGDYQCPYCGLFYAQTEQQIIKDYVNNGKVRMVFRNFAFLGPESTLAAEAAECANDQGKLWPYHDALYAAKVADAQAGGREDDGFFSQAKLVSLAQKVGLDVPTFTKCVANDSESSTVTAEMSQAGAAGVNSTPTFFINGTQILGAEPYATYKQAIDAALTAK